MVADIHATQEALLDCVCAALTTPVCKCYSVVGDPIIGFCCECEAGVSGEATAHFERVYDVDPSSLEQVSRVRPCKGGVVAADFVIVVTRCYPTLDEEGQLPDSTAQDEAARELNHDVSRVWNALTCCKDLTMRIRDVAVDSAPEAGCAALAARVTVEVRPAAPEESP